MALPVRQEGLFVRGGRSQHGATLWAGCPLHPWCFFRLRHEVTIEFDARLATIPAETLFEFFLNRSTFCTRVSVAFGGMAHTIFAERELET